MIYRPESKKTGYGDRIPTPPRPMDPDLVYVECQRCGRPILWESGQTASILAQAGIDMSKVDDHCFIASDGCPHCAPDKVSFETKLIRLDEELSSHLALLELADLKPVGTA